MFRKDLSEEISGQNLAKTSVKKKMKQQLLNQYPSLETFIQDLFQKKNSIVVIKCSNKIQLFAFNNTVLFFSIRDGPFFPTLKLLHSYPDILPPIQVDEGAIRHIIGGADVMIPGLISKGGKLPEENIPKGSMIAIMAEDKKHALGIGVLEVETSQIPVVKKGVAAQTIHHLTDGLWNYISEK
ncbi:mct-1 protein [Anaeramoeba ignava]|uniref:Mct-1 protein n=1 Tax=Anaeramoeba ignava TaxID=1746090 RepID=A0A9Q0LXI8_ANAIG|nr:mct-1 protein [Anaeramoeba ignava]